jgi:hypothetical protein
MELENDTAPTEGFSFLISLNDQDTLVLMSASVLAVDALSWIQLF